MKTSFAKNTACPNAANKAKKSFDALDCSISIQTTDYYQDSTGKVVKITLLVIGACIVFVSILGYFDTPSIISQIIHAVIRTGTGTVSGSSPVTTSSMLRSMGYPTRSTVVPLIQNSFLGLAIVGIGITGFGIMSKNLKKQFHAEPPAENDDKKTAGNEFSNTKKGEQSSLRILQERLAKGEITSSEFLRLRRLLESD